MTFGHRPARTSPTSTRPRSDSRIAAGRCIPDNRGRENTLEAFATAVGLGLRYVETDVHATRDGVVVAFHDACLDRVTDGSGSIADRTWAQVSQVRVDRPVCRAAPGPVPARLSAHALQHRHQGTGRRRPAGG
ncbi:MAG: hypothetical protein IPM08_12480 [Actinomycetales bacterium]|nr:hypothetical protein [Actinomycetales bacterium]